MVGPVLNKLVELRNRPTNGKSSPLGELESCTALALMNPKGVTFTAPALNAGTKPSFTGASIGSTRTGATAATTVGPEGGLAACASEGCRGSGSAELSMGLAYDGAAADEATAERSGVALGCAAAARSDAVNTPLRLSASTRS